MPASDKSPLTNRLIARCDAETRERLLAAGEVVPVKRKYVMLDIDRPITHVYFPIDCVGSVVSATLDRVAVETATVGCEGMVGLPIFLGSDRTSTQTFCQVSGSALRVDAGAFRQELERSACLRSALGAYTLAFITQTAQTSACNRLHSIRQRCVRWLLETEDRAGPTFDLTQEFLAEMLGVRRASVSEVAGALQRDGLIAYEYRRITVLNRPGLEASVCDCYRIVKREYDRLIEGQETRAVFEDVDTSRDECTVLEPPSAPRADSLE